MSLNFPPNAAIALAASLACAFSFGAEVPAPNVLQWLSPNQSPPPIALPADLPVLPPAQQARMDAVLMEIDIAQLQALYAARRYTVTEVTRWYMGRIARYNPIYHSVQSVDVKGALATARREDLQRDGA